MSLPRSASATHSFDRPKHFGIRDIFLLCLLLLSFSSLILSFVFLFEIGLGCDLAQRHKTRVWGSGRQRTYQLLTFND